MFDAADHKKERLPGDDTKTTITILDEDFPGTLAFEETEVTVTRDKEKIDVKLLRQEGSDGKITCEIKTEPFQEEGVDGENKYAGNAVEYEDYCPKLEIVEFDNGEREQIVSI